MRRKFGLAAATVALVAIAVTPASAGASGSPLGPPAAPITAPFQQCAAVYLDPSCGYLIDITSAGASAVYVDPSIGFYEGSDDVLVGVQNDSSAPVSSIHVGVPGSGYGSFAFDGDGLCTPGGGPVPADCPFGPLGDPGDYFGPDATLTPDAATPSTDDGTVVFPTPLQPGQYTYFSLEAPFVGAAVVTGTQNDVIGTLLTDSTNSSNTGVHLVAASPVNVTDKATILGANAGSAGGTVTYTVFSDPACTVQVASGGAAKTVTSGTAAASDPFGASLPTNAIYYVQVSYTGDAAGVTHNDPTTTNCGDETLTFGTPPVKAQATIATTLVASNGQTGGQLTVPTGTAVHDTTSVTSGGAPQSGRVTYYVYSDAACSTQVPGINLGSGAAAGGVYPPSATVTLPNGTYYFQAIYSGNQSLAGGRSPCTEVLTVAPPCACGKLFGYLSSFHTFGAGSTRLEFNIHSAIACTAGAGGCAGTLTLTAPRHAKFIDTTKAKNGATGLKLGRSTATLTFNCAGPCAASTVQQPFTLQWLAFKRIKIRHKHKKATFRTVPDPSFLPKGRANTTKTMKLVETCNGVVTKKTLKVHFDKHGHVDYKASDLNGDGVRDGHQLTDTTGFV